MPSKEKRHAATISLQGNLELSRTGSAVVVTVTDEGKLLGSIEIGSGSVIWWGRGKRTGKRVWWGSLARLLEDAPGRTIKLKKA